MIRMEEKKESLPEKVKLKMENLEQSTEETVNVPEVTGGIKERKSRIEALRKSLPFIEGDDARLGAVVNLLNNMEEGLIVKEDLQIQADEIKQLREQVSNQKAQLQENTVAVSQLYSQLQEVISVLKGMANRDSATLDKLDNYLDKWT